MRIFYKENQSFQKQAKISRTLLPRRLLYEPPAHIQVDPTIQSNNGQVPDDPPNCQEVMDLGKAIEGFVLDEAANRTSKSTKSNKVIDGENKNLKNFWEVLATEDDATESSENSRPKFPHAQSLNNDDMDTSENYAADAEN